VGLRTSSVRGPRRRGVQKELCVPPPLKLLVLTLLLVAWFYTLVILIYTYIYILYYSCVTHNRPFKGEIVIFA
jgi:hypothetical protein